MKRSFKTATAVLSLLVFAFLNASAFAEGVGKISGRVVDAETGIELPGTVIRIEGTDYGNMAGPDGSYFIWTVMTGTYTLTAHLLGYETKTISNVEVIANRTTEVNFKLQFSASIIPNARKIHQQYLEKLKIKTEQVDPVIDSLESYFLGIGLVVENGIHWSPNVDCDTVPYDS